MERLTCHEAIHQSKPHTKQLISAYINLNGKPVIELGLAKLRWRGITEIRTSSQLREAQHEIRDFAHYLLYRWLEQKLNAN